MTDPFKRFKFLQPTAITINGREVIIKAESYRSSKELQLLESSGNDALLRFYSLTYAGETATELLNEVEVIELIGQSRFDAA